VAEKSLTAHAYCPWPVDRQSSPFSIGRLGAFLPVVNPSVLYSVMTLYTFIGSHDMIA
jgi:hypothetical protein